MTEQRREKILAAANVFLDALSVSIDSELSPQLTGEAMALAVERLVELELVPTRLESEDTVIVDLTALVAGALKVMVIMTRHLDRYGDGFDLSALVLDIREQLESNLPEVP